ncbi:MAG: hypothetical protein NTV94_01840, partial [Planctomycetota bacterium]|nr:hypothetical protein [Planctomycetota bacterium]
MTDGPHEPGNSADGSEQAVGMLADRLFRHESARLRSGLIRRLGTSRLDLIDDIIQETLLAALRHWRFAGIPQNPAAWLVRVAQHKAVDRVRKDRRHAAAEVELLAWAAARESKLSTPAASDDPIDLMLLCAHPLLQEQDRVILTLSLSAGFGISEIARAFIISDAAAEQRLVRAKRTLRTSNVSLELADREIPERLASVFHTLYLMLNEGYATHSTDVKTRLDLLAETRYLLGLLQESPLVPDELHPDVHALSALAAFLWARSGTRLDAAGGLILMEDQDRSLWDRGAIGEGLWHLARSSSGEQLTPFGVEAAIAACHAAAPTFAQTDWAQIIGLYALLKRMKPTAVVLLKAAAA